MKNKNFTDVFFELFCLIKLTILNIGAKKGKLTQKGDEIVKTALLTS